MPAEVQPFPVEGGFAPLTDREFELFRSLIYEHTGIALGPQKRRLLQARLGKRLRALGLDSLTAYHSFLMEQDPMHEELRHCLNAITTNKTDFFREPHHFRYLAEVWAPEMRARAASSGVRRVRMWSAGCSTGEEPYTIAITLHEAFSGLRGWDVRILASDIDTEVLARAQAGIYPLQQVEPVPRRFLERYFERGVGANAGTVRVRSAVRDLVTFRHINLLDDPWPIRTRFDAVFCRNVIIYFDRPTQQRLLRRLAALITDGGLLFLGHSESALGLLAGLRHRGSTVYQTGERSDHGIHDPRR